MHAQLLYRFVIVYNYSDVYCVIITELGAQCR